MARHIAEGFMTVSWAPGGDPGALNLAANLSALAFADDRTFWDEFCAVRQCGAHAAPGRPGHARRVCGVGRG